MKFLKTIILLFNCTISFAQKGDTAKALQILQPYFGNFPIAKNMDQWRNFILSSEELKVDSTNAYNSVFTQYINDSSIKQVFSNLPLSKTFLVINRSIFKDTINGVIDTLDICSIKFEFNNETKQHFINKAFLKIYRQLKAPLPNKVYWGIPSTSSLQGVYSFKINKKNSLSYIQILQQKLPNTTNSVIAITIYKTKNYNLNITALPSFYGNWFVRRRITN